LTKARDLFSSLAASGTGISSKAPDALEHVIKLPLQLRQLGPDH
jgi:hypothetical protein